MKNQTELKIRLDIWYLVAMVTQNMYTYLNTIISAHTNHFSFDSNGSVNGLVTCSAVDTIVTRDFALLKVWVADPSLGELYRRHIDAHNTKVLTSTYPDAGFDVFCPTEVVFSVPFKNQMVGFGIRTEMVYLGGSSPIPCGFDLRPRSSISKTPLMLSNHVGTVDAGYRGELMGAFRWLPENPSSYLVEASTRLVQICHPTLCPILVVLVDSLEELSSTERGNGGFGSTGIVGHL